MNNKYVLLIIGFVLGLFTSSFIFLYYNFQQRIASVPVNNSENIDHSQHMAGGMPSMNSMMKEYTDLDYLNLMIIHHQDAVDMSKRALVNSSNSFIRQLSNTIIL